jgi:hypothetical protein
VPATVPAITLLLFPARRLYNPALSSALCNEVM